MLRKRTEKRKREETRRLVHALLYAALLHLLLFTVAGLFLDLPVSTSPPAGSDPPYGTLSAQVKIDLSSESKETGSTAPPPGGTSPGDSSPESASPGGSSADSPSADDTPAEKTGGTSSSRSTGESTGDRAQGSTGRNTRFSTAKSSEAGENTDDESSTHNPKRNTGQPTEDGAKTAKTPVGSGPRASPSPNEGGAETTDTPRPTGDGGARTTDAAPSSKNRRKEAFTRYLQALLKDHRRYPLAARKKEIEGNVIFSIYVGRGGTLRQLTLSGSSGSGILDRAARALIHKVFPVDYQLGDEVNTTIRIRYRLDDT